MTLSSKVNKLLGPSILESNCRIVEIALENRDDFDDLEESTILEMESVLSKLNYKINRRYWSFSKLVKDLVIPNLDTLDPVIDIFTDQGWYVDRCVRNWCLFDGPRIIRYGINDFTPCAYLGYPDYDLSSNNRVVHIILYISSNNVNA